MKNFIIWLQNVIHFFKIRYSKEYYRKCTSDDLLIKIKRESEECAHRKFNSELMESLLYKLKLRDYSAMEKALIIMSNSNNFDCMQMAINRQPSYGKYCADQLMITARGHLKLCGHTDRACWAHKRLMLAQKWYSVSGTLTQDLEQEINIGLKKVSWVVGRK